MKKGQLHPGVVALVLVVVLGVAAGVVYNLTNTPITTGMEGGGFPSKGGPPSGGDKKDEGAKSKESTTPAVTKTAPGKDNKTK